MILADATSSPGKVSNLSLEETPVGHLDKEPIEIPLPPIKKNQQIGRIADVLRHKSSYHNSASIKDPYRILDNYCILGCSFSTSNKSELRKHLILYHKAKDLEKWGLNR